MSKKATVGKPGKQSVTSEVSSPAEALSHVAQHGQPKMDKANTIASNNPATVKGYTPLGPGIKRPSGKPVGGNETKGEWKYD